MENGKFEEKNNVLIEYSMKRFSFFSFENEMIQYFR